MKNSAGEPVTVGMDVDRLDLYKKGGKVLAINTARTGQKVLVRWPGLNDEWCKPDLLYAAGTVGV